MKRYRVLNFSFDSRSQLMKDGLMTEADRQRTCDGILRQFGGQNPDRTLTDFVDFGALPWSVVTHHNLFLNQVRAAFVTGAYYPALTAACALGERMLNRLILAVRGHFQHTRSFQDVPEIRKGEPISNWATMIGILTAWRVLQPLAAFDFNALRLARNRSLHFNPELDDNSREFALSACNSLCRVVQSQYSPIGPMPWYMGGTPGATFVKLEFESHPFVREIVIPCCAYVGPRAALRFDPQTGRGTVHDCEYPEKEITDERFAELFRSEEPVTPQR